MSTTLRSERLKDMAISLPSQGLSVTIARLDAGRYDIDAVGETLHIPQLVVYNFFAKGIVSALGLESSVFGIVLKGDDVWYLGHDQSNETVTFSCLDDDTVFTIQPDSETNLVRLQLSQDQILETSHLEDFECNDRSKLRFLYTALNQKYSEELLSVNCLIPYDDGEDPPYATLDICGMRCLWNFQCRASNICTSCRWFSGSKCG
jgi:hypothetical protein